MVQKIWSIKILGPKTFWIHKNFCPKERGPKLSLSKKVWVHKNFRSNKNLGQKNAIKNTFDPELFGSKHFLDLNVFGSKNLPGKFLIKTIFGLKKCRSKTIWINFIGSNKIRCKKNLVQKNEDPLTTIRSVTADIFLIWTNVARTNVTWPNVTWELASVKESPRNLPVKSKSG